MSETAATHRPCRDCGTAIPATTAMLCHPCRDKSRIANGAKSNALRRAREHGAVPVLMPDAHPHIDRAAAALAGTAYRLNSVDDLPTVLAAIGWLR